MSLWLERSDWNCSRSPADLLRLSTGVSFSSDPASAIETTVLTGRQPAPAIFGTGVCMEPPLWRRWLSCKDFAAAVRAKGENAGFAGAAGEARTGACSRARSRQPGSVAAASGVRQSRRFRSRYRAREAAQYLFYRQQPPQMHQLQQSQLEVKPLLLPVSQLIEGSQHHLQKPRQLFFGEQGSRARCTPLLVG